MAENSSGAIVRDVHRSDDEGDVCVRVGDDGEERKKKEEEEALKKMIFGHPLYGLLLETHLNCLKTCSGHEMEISTIATSIATHDNVNSSSSDHDQFMETYCDTLKNLKEEMEIPLNEASAFVDSMQAQLEKLSRDSNVSKPESNTSNHTEHS